MKIEAMTQSQLDTEISLLRGEDVVNYSGDIALALGLFNEIDRAADASFRCSGRLWMVAWHRSSRCGANYKQQTHWFGSLPLAWAAAWYAWKTKHPDLSGMFVENDIEYSP